MCGLFGFVGKDFDLGVLRNAAREAGKRGPHAYGFSWHDGNQVRSCKGAGSMHDHLNTLDRIVAPKFVVGVSRLATFGAWQVIDNNPPFADKGRAFVHNGNAYNWQEIGERLGYRFATQSDTEALWALYAKKGSLTSVWQEIAPQVPTALLVGNQQSIFVFRHKHPLYWLRYRDGIYFGSRKFDDLCRLIPEQLEFKIDADLMDDLNPLDA